MFPIIYHSNNQYYINLSPSTPPVSTGSCSAQVALELRPAAGGATAGDLSLYRSRIGALD